MALVSEYLNNVKSVMSNITLLFAPLATSPNFGSDTIGSSKGQSEMTHKGRSSDPNNAVNSLDMISMRLEHTVSFCQLYFFVVLFSLNFLIHDHNLHALNTR